MQVAARVVTSVAAAPAAGAEERPCYRFIAPLYADLRRMAGALLRNETANVSLVATALTHDAVLRLLGLERIEIRSSEHFLSLAAGEMRRILVDYARKRMAGKRRGVKCELDDELMGDSRLEEVLAVEFLMDGLEEADAVAYEVTRLHFYGGMTFAEIGQVMGMSATGALREWQYARVWLYERLVERGG